VKRTLGRLESQLLAWAQMRQRQILRKGELVQPLRMTPNQEAKTLSRLAKAGIIARVWRGVYLVPPRLPLGGRWSPSEALALATLMEDRQGAYQICGPNAFNRHGFDEQIPTRVYAYNNRLSGERRVGAVALSLIKVAGGRLGDTEVVNSADGTAAVYSSRSRSLVDAVYDWSRFGSLPAAYGWIRRELAAGRVEAADLVRLTLRYGDVGTIRRVGALLERDGVSERLLRKLERSLGPSSGSIPWIPRRPKRGRLDQRWRIVWNESA
jgi:predicted transcriptional regulator of viral defense system